MDCCTYTATVLCTFLAFTTSTSVRTEPQATLAAPEEKKNFRASGDYNAPEDALLRDSESG